LHKLGMSLGAGTGAGLFILLLALPGVPPVAADEAPTTAAPAAPLPVFGPPFDPASLARWTYALEPQVSTTPLRHSTVRKIGYGTTQFVEVVETASGTYSSDGLTSSHIAYPGVHKRRQARSEWGLAGAIDAGSFVTVTRFDGGQLVMTADATCVVTASGVRC